MEKRSDSNQRFLIAILLFLFNFCSVYAGTNSKNSESSKEDHDMAKISDAKMLGIPPIHGTSWSVVSIYPKGSHPGTLVHNLEFIFSKNGKYEFQALTNSMGQSGAYKVRGNTVTTYQEGGDLTKTSFAMTWNSVGKFLELNDGKLIFRMEYKGKIDY